MPHTKQSHKQFLFLKLLLQTFQGEVVEIKGEIGTSLEGNLFFSAGKQGQLISVNKWLTKLVHMRNKTSEFYEADFASEFFVLIYYLAKFSLVLHQYTLTASNYFQNSCFDLF